MKRDIAPSSGAAPPANISRTAATLRTACSSARWQTAETGMPVSLTARASSSGT
ncbi:hypothetical protein ACFQXA_06000 [Nocardiopsis composta]